MRRHPVRKFFGLTVLYIAVIIGIFVLQFKTESVISKSLGSLNFTLSQTETENNEIKFKNQFRVGFRGISFSSDERYPAVARNSSTGEEISLELDSYAESSEHSVEFIFKDGSYIVFNETENPNGEHELAVGAFPSADYDLITIPCKISQSYNIDRVSSSNLILTAKTGEYSFTAHDISEFGITFTKMDSVAKFAYYDTTKQFTFESVAGLVGTSAETFQQTSKILRASLVSQVEQILSSSRTDTLSELDIVSYVAEMAALGKYNAAIDSVPDSFKRGNKRTYVSSPYFNNLANMNRSLVVQTEKYASLVASRTLDIFTVEGITDYILREKKKSSVLSLLAYPASMAEFAPSVAQAGSILDVYADLYKKDKTLTTPLESVLEMCILKIQDACSLEEGKLALAESDGTPVTFYQSVTTGNALVKVGKIKGNTQCVEAGYLMMHSALSSESIDMRALSSIYKVLAPDNFYYPHTEIIGYDGVEPIWAWTCARSISYSVDAEKIGKIDIEFPLNLTHFVIFNGIPNFHSQIEIQGQMFRTDPRFEVYNSSGYVYQNNSKALFIKSRHKSRVETIRLFYGTYNPRPAKTATSSSDSSVSAAKGERNGSVEGEKAPATANAGSPAETTVQ